MKPRFNQRVTNGRAWAIGRLTTRGFRISRRIVWGRLLARAERASGETIRKVHILMERNA